MGVWKSMQVTAIINTFEKEESESWKWTNWRADGYDVGKTCPTTVICIIFRQALKNWIKYHVKF